VVGMIISLKSLFEWYCKRFEPTAYEEQVILSKDKGPTSPSIQGSPRGIWYSNIGIEKRTMM